MATRGLRHALILISHRLAAVPQVLIQGHPLVSLVEVGRPTREDRLRFFNVARTSFFGHEALEVDTALHRTREQFCDLTDGSTLWELEGLRRISLAERMPVSDMRALINR
jgi:hypothetical protein